MRYRFSFPSRLHGGRVCTDVRSVLSLPLCFMGVESFASTAPWIFFIWEILSLNYIVEMKKINETFVCLKCGKAISEAKKTCRNHCPYCYISQHVDWAIPWDRAALISCWGTMVPFEYEIKNGQTKIHFRCILCNKLHWNKSSVDDELWLLDAFITTYKTQYPQI